MKVCFVGCGSIGKRHIENLKMICEKRKMDLELHLLRSTRNPINIQCNRVCYSIDELDSEYDAVFITNPTFLHYQTLKEMIGFSNAFFVEKPVFDGTDYDYSFINDDKKVYVACPLRYTGVLSNIKKYVDLDDIYSVRAICSSYLPDWRPGTDYRKCYSAHKDEGGGVRIDLIHEWDYLTFLFGFPEETKSISSKVSGLEIDSEDIAVYIANYKDKIVELHLDYFGRIPRRQCELYTDDGVYIVDIINNSIKKNEEIIFYSEEKANDKYINEIIYFIDNIVNDNKNINDLDNAIKVMKLVKK